MNVKRSFRFLWLGQSFANIGDVLYIVGLITLIYQLTGSATYMAMVPFFITMSQFVSGMLAPLIIDRFPLTRILAYSQTGKTALLFTLACLLYLDFSADILPIVFTLVFMISFLDGWATPVRNAMVPRLVTRYHLIKANSFLAILDQTIRLGGWSIGGILVVWMGSYQVIYLTVSLYVISSIMMFFIKDRDFDSKDEPSETQVLTVTKSTWAKMKHGWIFIWRNPAVRTVNIMGVLESLASTVWVAAILYIYVEEALQVGEEWWGYINASFFLGLILGGALCLRYSRFLNERLHVVIIVGTFIASMLTFLYSVNSLTWLALVLSLFIGFSEQTRGIAQQTTVQKSVAMKELASVFSAEHALQLVTYGSSVLLLGVLTDLWGVRMSFLLASILLLVSFGFAVFNQMHLKTVNETNNE